ncbi:MULTISPECIES: hypothetical protein [unclassified Ensifer]|uniref:hypothetical protein n=1 Tax=unclassified Ensifer TaxID=2633371 RepID=UPI00089059F5|nr:MULTISPECIES: hypothetical protein [unclassified Ensifer]MBD9596304.1 hypothetical protein [Ensifer sp. ENS05]SDN18142.1 hypothetical protein SAMN05216328_12083 [Ensifer sp. YR511]
MGEYWKAKVRIGLEELVDKAVVGGARHADVFAAIEAELARLRIAIELDPDPADDSTTRILGEPANDWPGAQR